MVGLQTPFSGKSTQLLSVLGISQGLFRFLSLKALYFYLKSRDISEPNWLQTIGHPHYFLSFYGFCGGHGADLKI
jgi:hypothetical protein